MIKILELIDGGFAGGGQIHIISLVKRLNKTIFNPVVAAMGGGKFEESIKECGIRFESVYQPKILRKKYLYPLIELCRREKIDIVHSHGGVSGFYGRMIKKYCPEIKSVHTIHGIHYINTKNYIRKYISQTIEQYLVKFTDRTICLTKDDFRIAEMMKITDPLRTSVVPNGIDLNEYKDLHKKDKDFLSKLNLSPDDFIVGNVSRFDVQKNQKLIIKAAAGLAEEHPDIKFVLVGNGRLYDQCRKLSRELNLEGRIYFAGEQMNLRDYYSVFDVFAFPTLWEGMPYVLLEAMACRLPIVCSDISSLREIVEDNNSALFINPIRETELKDKILKLHNDRGLSDKISSRAYEKVKYYSEYFTVKKIEEIYTEVTGD